MISFIYLQVSFLKDDDCRTLCTKRYLPNDSISNMKLFVLKRGMSLNYQHHFIVGKYLFLSYNINIYCIVKYLI